MKVIEKQGFVLVREMSLFMSMFKKNIIYDVREQL